MKITKIFCLVIAGIFILSTFSILATALPVGAQPILRSHIYDPTASSTNWSGYAVTASSGAVTSVAGHWTVPSIQGTCPSTNQYSSFWVGIDGFSSNSVEQTGTDSDCQSGAPTYYAWYEFYPHPSYLITSVAIHPGDNIYASVTFSSRKFTLFLQDVTTGQSFTKSGKVNAQRSSAEWIAEAPSSSSGVLPLADFGTVNFNTDSATISGTTNYINGFPSASVYQINMVTSSGALKASTSSLGTNGAFSVTWQSAGP